MSCSISRTITTSPGRNARRERRGARGHRASQGRDARPAPACSGIIPGSMAIARLRRARQGSARVAEQRVARRGPRDEPQQGAAVLHLEWRPRSCSPSAAWSSSPPASMKCRASIRTSTPSWPRRPIWSKSSAASIRNSSRCAPPANRRRIEGGWIDWSLEPGVAPYTPGSDCCNHRYFSMKRHPPQIHRAGAEPQLAGDPREDAGRGVLHDGVPARPPVSTCRAMTTSCP